jgi:hypothetical protein
LSQPFEIQALPEAGYVATNGTQTVQLLEGEGRVFRRRAVKLGSDGASSVEWCVVELDGVRVYVDGDNVIVTREDMYP